MDNGNVKIHKYLNAKMTFGNWEIDVFMIMAALTFIMAGIALTMPRNNPHAKAAVTAAH